MVIESPLSPRRVISRDAVAMANRALDVIDGRSMLSVLEMAWPAVGDIVRLTAEYLGDQVPDSTGAPLLHRCMVRFMAEAQAWRVSGPSSKVLRRAVVALLVSAQDVADTRVVVKGVAWNPCRGVPLLHLLDGRSVVEARVSPGAWPRPAVMRSLCSYVLPSTTHTAMGADLFELLPEGAITWPR